MKPLSKKDELILTAKIKAYFRSFKQFVCCDELPDFKILYTDARKDPSIAYKAQVSLYGEPIILRCNIAEIDEKDHDFKYTLVHEFTHMYDYFMLHKTYDDAFLNRNMFLYTECHAVQIEILFCYKIVDTIFDSANFMKTDLDHMLDLPYIKNKTYANTVLNFLDNQSITNFHYMKTAYMYSYGATTILSQLLEQPMTFMNFEKPYDQELTKAQRILQNIKYDQLPSEKDLIRLGNINKKINQMFLENITLK